MVIPPDKEPISEKFAGSRTAHLQPLIAFLKVQGNIPWQAPSYRPVGVDEFDFDRDGFGNFYFTSPLDLAAVREKFVLPATISFTPGGTIWDERNLVGIAQATPVTSPLHFE